jgi:hypothetical protein
MSMWLRMILLKPVALITVKGVVDGTQPLLAQSLDELIPPVCPCHSPVFLTLSVFFPSGPSENSSNSVYHVPSTSLSI